MNIELTLKLNNSKIKLTIKEAKELYNQLSILFDKNATHPLLPTYPNIPNNPYGPYRIDPDNERYPFYPNKITCRGDEKGLFINLKNEGLK